MSHYTQELNAANVAPNVTNEEHTDVHEVSPSPSTVKYKITLTLRSILNDRKHDCFSFLTYEHGLPWMCQVRVGDKVWLADALLRQGKVAFGTVMCLGGEGSFHNRPIPPNYVRVNLERVAVNLPLLIPVEEADQANLVDAVGSSVLWKKDLTFQAP